MKDYEVDVLIIGGGTGGTANPPAAPRLTAISGTGFAIITAKTGN